MTVLSLGNKKRKFPSIKAAYEAAKVNEPNLKYITFYMRVRAAEKQGGLGWKVGTAMQKPVRKYQRREQVAV